MKKRIIVLMAGILIIICGFIIKSSKRENFKERKDIDEIIWFNEKIAAYLRETAGKYILGIYNEGNKKKNEIDLVEGDLNSISWSPDGKYLTVDKGLDEVKETYIVSTENLELLGKIFTTGKVIWSPDSKKLLIGVKNNEKSNGNIDLALYYLWSERAEPLLKANKEFNYYPDYWKKDAIGYIKISDKSKESLEIKYELSLEEKIMSIVTAEKEINNKELKKIFLSLPKLDLDKLAKIYGDDSDTKVLEWISKQDVKDIEDIESIIRISLNFYDKEYDIISNLMKDIYLKDKVTFIKALFKVPEAMDEIAYAFRSLELYEKINIDMTEDLNMILDSNKLTKEEKKFAIEFLNLYALCGT